MRAAPIEVANPRTIPQITARTKFGIAATVGAQLREIIGKTNAIRAGIPTENNIFVSDNRDYVETDAEGEFSKWSAVPKVSDNQLILAPPMTSLMGQTLDEKFVQVSRNLTPYEEANFEVWVLALMSGETEIFWDVMEAVGQPNYSFTVEQSAALTVATVVLYDKRTKKSLQMDEVSF